MMIAAAITDPAFRKPYRPVLSRIERGAYDAAHKILSADLTKLEYAGPGARRSATVDIVAGIIMNSMHGVERW